MTTPDQYWPDTAINATPGFAAYAGMTREDYERQMREGVASHYNIAELAFQGIINAIEQIPLIGPLIAQAVTGVAGTLEELGQWFGNLRAFLNIDFLNPLFDAVTALGEFVASIINIIIDQIDDLTGVDLRAVVQALTGVAEGTMDDISTWAQNLINGNWIHQLSVSLTGLPGNVADIEAWAASLLTVGDKIPVANISGVDLGDFPNVLPIGNIGRPTTSVNLLDNPAFSLPVDTVDGWYWEGPQLFVFTLGGTVVALNPVPAAVTPVGKAVAPEYWSAFAINYPASAFPMSDSITAGRGLLVDAIGALKPGTKFAICGESQGAVIASKVYEDDILDVAGSLHDRVDDIVAACMFGNPRRASGSHAAGTTDPGGTGIATDDLMASTPAWWYDYTADGDFIGSVAAGAEGDWMVLVYDFLTNDWDGAILNLIENIISLFGNPWTGIPSVINALGQLIGDLGGIITSGVNPHTSYGISRIDGTNTAYELATTYLDTVGAANAPVVGTDYEDHTAGGSGSITVTANGTLLEWRHPKRIAVTGDQTVNVSGWVKASGLSATGSPLIIGLTTYLDDTKVADISIDTLASAADWAQLDGSYAIPDSGVDGVELRIAVGATATAGKVNFDDLSLTKTGLIKQGWITQLEDAWDHLTEIIRDGLITNPFTAATPLGNLWNAFRVHQDAVTSANATIEQLRNRIANLEGRNSAADDFERTGTLAGALWSVTETNPTYGEVRLNGHQAYWDESTTSASNYALCRFLGDSGGPYGDQYSLTAYQKVSVVVNSGPFHGFGTPAAIDLLAMLADDNSAYLCARWWGSGLFDLFYFDSGVLTSLLPDPVEVQVPGAGSALSIAVGNITTSEPNLITVYQNSSIVVDSIEDVDYASHDYSAERGWGMGLYARVTPTFGQYKPGSLHQWSAIDNIAGGS